MTMLLIFLSQCSIMGNEVLIMKITWLGQAGLLFETEDLTIIVDPYLSDSVVKVNPNNWRRVPVDEGLFDIHPDIYICTHDHLDHLDPETVPVYLSREDKQITVIGSAESYTKLLSYKHGHNYVRFDPGTRWTQSGVTITAIKAYHSEPTAIGIVVDDGEKKYYITGDTLYNDNIFNELPDDIYAVFLPINGVGNNMNMEDAALFAEKVNARYTVPVHFGMFDELDPKAFHVKHKVIPQLYKEIVFE